MGEKRKKVVIIGGGITGLSTAYFLQERLRQGGGNIECILIESEKRLGGKILTERVGDFIIEGGPDSFITLKPWGLELCRELGLTDRLVQTNPVEKAIYILSSGKLVPLPKGFNLMVPGRVTPFLLTPLVSLRGKVRMGLDLLIPRKDQPQDESIASFVRRRLGEEALQQFAEPILAGIYAGDAEQLSLMATFPQFAALERTHGSLIWAMWMQRWDAAKKGKPQSTWSLFVTLQNGLSSLVEALQKRLDRVTVYADRKVTFLCPKSNRYEVSLGDQRILADAVVIATGTTIAADWIKGWDASLAKLLREIQYASTATVSLGFREEEVSHPLNGFGFVVPRKEGRRIMAVTWSSTKFPGRAPAGHVLIRSFLGGAHQEGWVEQDDAALIAMVYKELRSVLGIRGQPVVARAFRWIKANPQYHVGHLDRVAEIEQKTNEHPGLFLAGAAYRGVGIPDCIQQGMDVAEKIARMCSHGSL